MDPHLTDLVYKHEYKLKIFDGLIEGSTDVVRSRMVVTHSQGRRGAGPVAHTTRPNPQVGRTTHTPP